MSLKWDGHAGEARRGEAASAGFVGLWARREIRALGLRVFFN